MNWEEHYESGHTPWDLGQAHPELERRLTEGWSEDVRSKRVFVPGCGTGHDALAFARAESIVTAVDLVDATGGRLGRDLTARGGEFLQGDALELDRPNGFDLVWDHTFFCALEPERRSAWSRMVRRLVRRGGLVAGISFPEDRDEESGGPPWGMSVGELSKWLDGFDLVEAAEPLETVDRRRGREHWYLLEAGRVD
ncbi:MAG: methyltransferase domain-containing protein [Thermoanaerobaculia bacterium]|nr:methyltransferase domain-containing protein [Thermoanaerobaculia bacterium]